MNIKKQLRYKRNVSNCARRMIGELIHKGTCTHTCKSVSAAAVALCLIIRWGQRVKINGNTLTI